MAYRGPSVGPWHIAELDVHLINEVLRQIEEQIKLLRGLGPTTTTISIGPHTHASTATASTVSHVDLTGVTADQHHAKSHIHDGDGSGTVDSSALTYTPSDNGKWNSASDPGGLADAINQLAQRVSELETAVEAMGHARITDQLFAGSGLTFTESSESNTITITVP